MEAALDLLKGVGFGAVGVLVAGWLAVSFSAPGRRRNVLEWLSASALYVALLCLFASLSGRAWGADNWLATVAFGFLGVIFAGGLGVSLFMAGREVAGGEGPSQVDATH